MFVTIERESPLIINIFFKSTFKRVLPLPSESWEEFSGGVFCHYREAKATDDDDGGDGECSLMSVPSTVKLHPRAGDCLFSTSSLLLCSSSLNWDRVTKVGCV